MTTSTELLRTPLHDWHVANGGRMVDFAGWSMPVQYSSISDEHNATRNTVGVFDISHMGRLYFARPEAASFLDRMMTRRVADMKPGQVRYSLVCNEGGGILDDVLVYRLAGEFPLLVVVNASNREKIAGWFKQQSAALPHEASNAAFVDATLDTAMIAVQGPKAGEILQPIVARYFGDAKLDLGGMRYFHAMEAKFGIGISRTGYTGEDGYELICDPSCADSAIEIWEQIVDAARNVGGMAAGLGARDTLRLEAAMPLYGHELSETINPIQAGLNFAVNLAGREFVGRDALEGFTNDKNQPVRVGLQIAGKRVARQGSTVLQGDEVVGEVTSGTFSPTFDRPIAMAYVRPSAQAVGGKLAVDIRGMQHAATVVPLPFYERSNKN